MIGKLTAQRAALKAETEAEQRAARAAFHAAGGVCWPCRDTGWEAGKLQTPCRECGRGHAEQARRAERLAGDIIAAMGLPPLRAPQSFANFPRMEQPGARAVMEFMADWDGRTGLLLMGDKGRGKTGLLVGALKAAALRMGERNLTGARIAYSTSADLFDALREGYARGTHGKQMRRLQSVPLLGIDDLGVERPSDWVLERLFVLLNARYEACLPTFLTTNYTVDTLRARIGMRVVDRLVESCELMPVSGVNLRYWLRGISEPGRSAGSEPGATGQYAEMGDEGTHDGVWDRGEGER